MERWTSWVLRRRVVVMLFWLLVAVAGGATASTTSNALSYVFDLPGQPGFETNQQIVERFGGGGANDPLLLVARANAGADEFATTARQVAAAVPRTRVITPADPRW